jgi:hypothetical protein
MGHHPQARDVAAFLQATRNVPIVFVQCLSASKTFIAVGAYPPNGSYDECAT